MTRFKSKIDAWLVAVLVLASALCLYASYGVFTTAPAGSGWLAVLILPLGVGLPLWLLFTTDYALDTNTLFVRCGPLQWRIAIADIERIVPSSSPLASPALSLDRLRVDYGNQQYILISPENRQQFLDALDRLRSDPVQRG